MEPNSLGFSKGFQKQKWSSETTLKNDANPKSIMSRNIK